MTYYGSKQLADSFRTVRKNTVALADEIPEDKYGFKATPEVMSVREMLAHIVTTPAWQMEMHAKRIDRMEFAMFGAYMQHAKETADRLVSKADIIKALKEEGERFASFLAGLDETTLASTVSFPAPPFTRDPVASKGIWPETKSKGPTLTAWE